MEGIFLRKKFNSRLLLIFICGLFFIGLYIFLNIVDPEANATYLILGIIIFLAVIPSWFLNFGAFIHINENSIKAKYHWFGKIDCNLSDVTFAVAKINTLIIQLKDGKTHTIMGVENSWQLATEIRRNLSFELTEQPEPLIEKLNDIKTARKKRALYVFSGVALMFITLFATIYLTGARDLDEFGKIDWIIFAIMCVMEILIIIITFSFALKIGKTNIPIEKLQYDIQRRIIETKPLLPGNVIKVVTDENYSGRITLYGYPNQDSVYYVVQNIASDFTLFKSYESEIFENVEQLQDGLEELIDITKKLLP